GGIQWPKPEAELLSPGSERRLFEDGKYCHDDGKARFCFDHPSENPEPTDEEYPFILLTGRGSSAQWHTQTRTAKSGILQRLAPQANYLEIHPADAKALGLREDSQVKVRSRRGEIVVRAWQTATVGEGQVFLPMHFEETNQITLQVVDPISRQPSYKACAVAVERA
ncbi:MAG: molybdopterin oxidoreductase family protein, partial [Verrucomicrobiota bacterium]